MKAVEQASRDHPDIAGELQRQLQEFERRRNDRLTRAQKLSAPNSDALAERLLDRYSQDLDLSNPLDSGESEPLIPNLDGRYDYLEEIARGGMGAILKISDPVLQRELAMKVVLGDKAGDAPPQRLRRFLREARVTAQLSHPGVVPVHELNSDADGRFYFTMDRVIGQELRDFIRYARDGTSGWDRNRLLEVLLKVCDTLEYAHSRGIVHRDVKPANIMVGQFGEVYVMDWGLARILSDIEDEPLEDVISDSLASSQEGSTVITRDGSVVGTPSYMSPEQACPDQGSIGPWTDVYSVGALLYEILSGNPPYRTGDIP
ncbi:MAG: serine/threonine protein kinase, partial [Planctomycetes bacterium]|nr:serine/threonine protein kinase [Planctomycetota bacterium]